MFVVFTRCCDDITIKPHWSCKNCCLYFNLTHLDPSLIQNPTCNRAVKRIKVVFVSPPQIKPPAHLINQPSASTQTQLLQGITGDYICMFIILQINADEGSQTTTEEEVLLVKNINELNPEFIERLHHI